MADNLVQRMMDSEADANKDIASKSFHHTVQPDTSDPTITFIDQTTSLGGQSVHDELLRRAQQKASAETIADEKPVLGHYRDTLVGAIGQSKDLRRQITMRSRADRVAREERFGKLDDLAARGNSRTKRRNNRQAFYAVGDTDGDVGVAHSRQAYNTEASNQAQPKTSFREPPSRGYNPFQ